VHIYNRGVGFIGHLGLSGVLLSGKGNRGLGSVGELGLGVQSGTWVYRELGSIGGFVIGEFLSGKR